MGTRARTPSSALRAVHRCLRIFGVMVLATPTIVSGQVHERAAVRQIKVTGGFPALKLTPVLTLTDAVLDTRHVSALAVSAAGDLVIADGAERLLVFNPSGAKVRTIGRAGGGPGEFKGPLSLGWLHDTLVVLDHNQRRVSLFSLQTGTLLTSFPWAIKGRPEGLLNGGSSLFAVVESRTGKSRPVFNGTGTMPPLAEFGIAPVTAAGIGLPIAQLRDSVDRQTGSDCEASKGRIATFEAFFPDHGSMRALTPTAQLISANRDTFLLTIRQVDSGTPMAVIIGPSLRWPVTNAIWDSVAVEYRAAEKTAGIGRCVPPIVRPATLPAIRALSTDEVGVIWVEVADRVGTAMNALRPDGNALGAFHLPVRDETVPWVVRKLRLYVVLTDADGLQSVQVYRIGQ